MIVSLFLLVIIFVIFIFKINKTEINKPIERKFEPRQIVIRTNEAKYEGILIKKNGEIKDSDKILFVYSKPYGFGRHRYYVEHKSDIGSLFIPLTPDHIYKPTLFNREEFILGEPFSDTYVFYSSYNLLNI